MIDRKTRVCVYGRVQGVYFRYHTKLMAERFGLTGWVRNRSDGSVEAYFSGNGNDVAKILEWLHRGPETSVVDKVEVTEIDTPEPQTSGFNIRA